MWTFFEKIRNRFRPEARYRNADQGSREPQPKTLENVMERLRAIDDHMSDEARKMGDRASAVQQDVLAAQQDRLERMRAIARGECSECLGKGTIPTADLRGTVVCSRCRGTGKLQAM